MQLYKTLLLFAALLFALCACSEQSTVPKLPDEAAITTVRLTLVDSTTSDTTVVVWEDADGAGGNPPNRTDTLRIKANTTYLSRVEFLSVQVTGLVDVTPQILLEGVHHQVFYTFDASKLTMTVTDVDSNNRPLGLTARLATKDLTASTLGVALSHFKNADNKNGVDPSDESDVDVVFVVE